MSEKARKICRFLILGVCIAAGIYFGAYKMMFIPLFNFLYRQHYGMLTMLHSIEYIILISAGIIFTALSGLAGIAISWLLGLDRDGKQDNKRIHHRMKGRHTEGHHRVRMA